MSRYPGAIWRPSSIAHTSRSETRGIVIHWTVGHVAGDITVLDGPSVDVQFYVTKTGTVYQFLDSDSRAYHAKATANNTCIGIETEGKGEAWTSAQLESVAAVTAWCCEKYGIPVRHVDPSGYYRSTYLGIFGHGDLSVGGIRVDDNDHMDNVPTGTGYPLFLTRVAAHMNLQAAGVKPKLPKYERSLRVVVRRPDGSVVSTAGWRKSLGALRWLVANATKPGTEVALSWRGKVYRNREAKNVAASLTRRFL